MGDGRRETGSEEGSNRIPIWISILIVIHILDNGQTNENSFVFKLKAWRC